MACAFIISHNITSPLGLTTADNFLALKNGKSGIKLHQASQMSKVPFYVSLFAPDDFETDVKYTKFEKLLIASITDALTSLGSTPALGATGLIISSTKGNISLLETEKPSDALNKRIALHTSAKLVAAHVGLINQPVVISNACISGILGIVTAMRMIRSGQYETVIVSGADVISRFVLSGFQSFNAISAQPCRPFDLGRDGITLGEGASTIILSSNPKYRSLIKVVGGASSNDANHISAPSQTGQELGRAIGASIHEAGLTANQIQMISAHGTATVYNDEMEAKAVTLAGLNHVPLNSLKGYYGHTLGAAGLIESVIAIQSMTEGLVLPTKGFAKMGVSMPINVCNTLLNVPLTNVLKTASGFGGCNAAVVFSKCK
jgi:3-oxoacyl-[acyl-carrier-protein] synthase-1